jgi:hypothetical protein
MGLIGNRSILNKSYQRTYGGTTLAIAFHNNNKSMLMTTAQLRARGQLQFKKAAIPAGYGPGTAIMMPMKSGELGAVDLVGLGNVTAAALLVILADPIAIGGISTVTGSANAIGLIELAATSIGSSTVTANTVLSVSMAGAITGVGTMTANLGALIPMSASVDGIATAAANLKGTNRMGAILSIGASGYLSNDDVERLSEAVWDITLTNHLTAGSTGRALSDAGGAGNPWSSPLIGNDAPGTFGERVQKLLTSAKFIGLK